MAALIGAALLAFAPVSRAQWVTQTNSLKAGWNAVFLQVDASHATLDELVGADLTNPINEIWYWQPALPTGQFIDTPQIPIGGGSQWVLWNRQNAPSSVLQRLAPNGAYLVRLPSDATPYSWRVKGKPVLPTYRWTLTGLNFIGFPTPPRTAPSFDAFVAPAPELLQNGEFFRYQGGELGATNPVRVIAPRATPVLRDQAYWIRSGETYNTYFGPIEVRPSSSSGFRFGDSKGQATFRARNRANVPITLSLRYLPSELPPPGQTSIAGLPPLLVRGPINTTNLTFGYSVLSTDTQPAQTWTLAADGQVGSEVEVVLGLNRSQMAGPAGALFAGVLRLTDSLGLSQIDLEVSAIKESPVGLWVGGASVAYVSHYLKPYAKAESEGEFTTLLERLQLAEGVNGYHYEWDSNTGRVLVFGGPEQKTGSYLLDGPIKVDSGTVATPHPLRLIVHNNGSSAQLLQKVFHGISPGSNIVLTTKESLLHSGLLAQARRISAVHLPTSAANIPWNFSGAMEPGGSITVTVPLAFDDQASNPFLHTYHPDHDNLDPLFATQLDRGLESYGVRRQITLSFTAPEDDFNSLTRGSQDFSGNYAETITFEGRGSDTREFQVLGTFTLKRISDIASLTTQ